MNLQQGEINVELREIYSGPEEEINLFIHGYSSIRNEDQFRERRSQILAACSRGQVYLLDWDAGDASAAFGLGLVYDLFALGYAIGGGGAAALGRAAMKQAAKAAVKSAGRHVLVQAINFRRYRPQAEKVGHHLKSLVLRLPNATTTRINLYGHSLGARVIYAALHSDWSNLDLNNVVLMGAATPADAPDWDECIERIGGTLYNAYSEADVVLAIKPDLERNAGSQPIEVQSPPTRRRLRNRQCKGFGHGDYWKNLGRVLTTLGIAVPGDS